MDKWPDKDPNEVLDYDIDWAGTSDAPGRAFGDNLNSSLWMITKNDDSVLIMTTNSFAATAAKVWLSGGTLGTQYKLTNRVTTVGGRTMDKSGFLLIKEK